MLLNSELEKLWKKAAVAQFEVVSRHVSGWKKEVH
jgi:hypothetical protein